jgi:hypothetical protein
MTRITPGRQRKLQRITHLAAAAVLLAYVYTPAEGELELVVRFVVFPLLLVSGVAMWQGARIRRALGRTRSTRARVARSS